MVCAGCIGNTPEILEVSILILYSDVLLEAWSVVGLWQCCTCLLWQWQWFLLTNVTPFFLHHSYWWAVQCGRRTLSIFLWEGPVHPPSLWLIWPNHFGSVNNQFLPRHIAQRSAEGQSLGIFSTLLVRCLKDDCCSSSFAWLMCVFCKEIFPLSVLSHFLGVHWTLSTLGCIIVEPEDGLVTHWAHAADLQPLQQALLVKCMWTGTHSQFISGPEFLQAHSTSLSKEA